MLCIRVILSPAGPLTCWVSSLFTKWANKQQQQQQQRREVGPTVCAPAVLPLSVRQSADAGFQSLLLQHAGRRAGRVEIQHLPGTHGQHVHAVKHDERSLVCVMDKYQRE